MWDMSALYQRLKELDPERFQQLVAQLLQDKHPNSDIKHVATGGSDKGIDLFQGDLSGQLVVWQVKYFRNGFGQSQREQAKHSLRTVVKNFAVNEWILCVPIDLDVKTLSWLQKLGKAYGKQGVKIGLLQASNMVSELIHRRSLREHYFPNFDLDIGLIRSAISRMQSLSVDEIDKLAAYDVAELERFLKEKDARFDYQIVYGGDVNAALAEQIPSNPRPMASLYDGRKRINIYSRDSEAIRRDPIQCQFTLEGHRKFQELVKTGKSVTFSREEIVKLKTPIDFLMPPAELRGEVQISSNPIDKVVPMKVVFEGGGEKVTFEYLEFDFLRIGSEEMEIATRADDKLPFSLQAVIPLGKVREGRVHLKAHFGGHDVYAVHKVIQAFHCFHKGGLIHFHDLKRGVSFGTGSATYPMPAENLGYAELISRLKDIATAFETSFVIPEVLSTEDIDIILLVSSFLKGEPPPIRTVTMDVVKSEDHPDWLNAEFLNARLENESGCVVMSLCGKEISVGPPALVFDKLQLVKRERVRKAYTRAKKGEAITVQCSVLSPPRPEFTSPLVP